MSTQYTLLILGGTGLVGSFCLSTLQSALQNPNLRIRGKPARVIATARSKAKCEGLVKAGLAKEWRVLDLEEPRSFKGVLQGELGGDIPHQEVKQGGVLTLVGIGVDGVFFMNGYTAR